jgi:hypothetical protein
MGKHWRKRPQGYLNLATFMLRKLYNSFAPNDLETAEAMEKIKPNAVVKAEITQPRNLAFHRKFFALIDVAFEAWDCPVTEYKGQAIAKNRDRFRKDLTILAGFGYPVCNVKGDVRYEATSISFARMDEIEFEALYSRVVDVILTRVLTHYTRADLDNVVNQILGFV